MFFMTADSAVMKNVNETGGNARRTIAPVHATPAYLAGQEPEFLDAAGLQARFGIKRSLAYSLLADGAIKGVSLRRRNQTRGKRLFCCDSVRQYLSQQIQTAERRK
jgi:hypothetical protein